MREKTILIVDDEKRMADSLRDLLTGAGYRAQAVYSGQAAIDLLCRQSFHVVVTDLRMGEIDGLSLIHHIHERHPQALIIVITGYASTESAVEAVHYQVFDYLRKPFAFELFLKTIEKAFQRLETEQLREDTAAMITHDIKIPLTSIIGFASMVFDRERKEFHPRAREFAEAIQSNGQKILALIENYLTTCRIEAGTLKIVPAAVDPRQLMLDIIETYTIEANRRGRKIEYELNELPGTIVVDEPLVYRAISNLLANAIKYGNATGPILVRVGMLAAGESPIKAATLRIEVINHADMLAVDDFEHLFERYKRLATRPGVEGSGLGLYVVYAIARAHGGDATAQVQDDGQVRLTLYLPRETDTAHGAGAAGMATE